MRLLKAVREPEWRLLHRIADDLEPRFRKTFLDAFKNARGEVTLTGIQQAVEVGNIAAFDQLVPWEQLVQEASKDVQVLYREGVERAAGGTIKFLPAQVTQGVNVGFDILDPRVVDFMRDRSMGLVTEVTDGTRQALRSSMTRHIERGTNPRRAARSLRGTVGLTERQARAADNFLARQLMDGNTTVGQAERRAERYRNRLLRQRTENIARTESIRAANAGQNQLWQQLEAEGVIDQSEMEREWIVTPDDRLCEQCAELEGVRVGLKESFPGADTPPLHPQCVVGDTLVTAEGITGHSKRWHEGPVVHIRTREGHELTCTPNHPILTRDGWVPAGDLMEGHNVVRHVGAQRPLATRLHDQQVVARIEELVNARIQASEVLSRPVPVTAEHFHGDGRYSEVAIVGTNLHLRDGRQASRSQQLRQPRFVRAVVFALQRARTRSTNAARHWYRRAATRIVRFLDLASALLAGHARPLHQFRFALSSQADAGITEVPFDSTAADTGALGELVDGLPFVIAADEVVEIRKVHFSGHVFNLETDAGMYVANGIVTHNCRCAVQLVQVA